MVPYNGAIQRVQNMNLYSADAQAQNKETVQGIAKTFGDSGNAITATFQQSLAKIIEASTKLADFQEKIQNQMLEKMSTANVEDLEKIPPAYQATLAIISDTSEKSVANVLNSAKAAQSTMLAGNEDLIKAALETKVQMLNLENAQRDKLLAQSKAAMEIEKEEALGRREELKEKAERLSNIYTQYREAYDKLIDAAIQRMNDPNSKSYTLKTVEPWIDWEKGEVHKGTVSWEQRR
jgi:hypothetical protein